MLPVEIVPVDGKTLVLRARGSELLILPHHIGHLKACASPKEFTTYFISNALLNRPARKLFEAWLRKDKTLWQRIYRTIQNEMEVSEEDMQVEEVAEKPTPKKKASEEKKAEPKAKKEPTKKKADTEEKKTKSTTKKASKKSASETKKKKTTKKAKPAAKKTAAKKKTKTATKKKTTTAKKTTKTAAKKKSATKKKKKG